MEERLRKSDWTVRDVPISVARRIVENYHYAAGASNTATYLHGLFLDSGCVCEKCRGECWGVAWWIPPTRTAANATYPSNWQGVLCLSRLVIVPEAPKNACTFLLSRSRRLIDPIRWPCLVTYADQWQGHTGSIYLADNWTPMGLTKPERTYCINGRLVARKAGGHTRTHGEMMALGAVLVGAFSRHKFSLIRKSYGK